MDKITLQTLNELVETNEKLIQQLTATNTLAMNALHQNTRACITLINEISKPEAKAKEYMDYKEAAEYLGMPKGTLYQKTHKKCIPHSKINKTIRFSKTELDQWMQENRVFTGPEIDKMSRHLIRK